MTVEARTDWKTDFATGLEGFGNASLGTALVGEGFSTLINSIVDMPGLYAAFIVYGLVLGVLPKLAASRISPKKGN